MQIKPVIIIIILFQSVILFTLWLHSSNYSVTRKMIGDTTNPNSPAEQEPEVLVVCHSNRTQNANTGDAREESLACCPKSSPHLVGPLRVEFNWDRTMASVRADFNSSLREGGRYRPPDCISHHKVAIIIPFRNRHRHLIQWLHHVHPILQRQQLDYGVYVINQDGEGTFNRAKLMNVGFAEAMKDNYTCFVFSDVDLLPIDDRNIYGCFRKPRHLSVAVDKFNFMLPYSTIFGGVVSFSKRQFLAINGFPNDFWGWGGEDDDIYQRTAMTFTSVSRPDMQTGRFIMIKHNADLHNDPNPERFLQIKKTYFRMGIDGINSLTYSVNKVEMDKLYTFITVDLGSPSSAPTPAAVGSTTDGHTD